MVVYPVDVIIFYMVSLLCLHVMLSQQQCYSIPIAVKVFPLVQRGSHGR